MTQRCEKRGGINLAQGYTDELPPEDLREMAVEAIRNGWNQYSLTWGDTELRAAVAQKLESFNAIEADPSTDVTITCGATEGLASSILALLDRGDEVLLFEPFYENYAPNIFLADGVPRYIRFPENYDLPEERIKEAIGSRTKAIILNTPQNPTGKVYRKDELRLLADLCVDYGLLAICDETYERFTYDALPHVSLASLSGMEDRTLTVGTFSKTFFVTGWRVGYVAAPEDLSESVRKVHDYLTVAAPTPFQRALVHGSDVDPNYYTTLIRAYEQKREIICRALNECGFHFRAPEGAYYVMADFSDLSGSADTDFALELLDKGGIATVPGSSFYGSRNIPRKQVRFSFCKSDAILQKCASLLKSFADKTGRTVNEARVGRNRSET